MTYEPRTPACGAEDMIDRDPVIGQQSSLSNRARYEPPGLTMLGTLAELTQGATGAFSDGGGFTDNPGGSGGI
jgi:hypothetical protein